jgi:hypothetical protein
MGEDMEAYEDEPERCECGETTPEDCTERPSRHCGLWNFMAAEEATWD